MKESSLSQIIQNLDRTKFEEHYIIFPSTKSSIVQGLSVGKYGFDSLALSKPRNRWSESKLNATYYALKFVDELKKECDMIQG